jgi:hypothetical protein
MTSIPIGMHHHRLLIQKIVRRSQITLEKASPQAWPSLAGLVAWATDQVLGEEERRDSATYGELAGWLAAEASWHLVTAAGLPVAGLTDPALPKLLANLDRRPLIARRRLLATAVHRTGPNYPPATPTVRTLPAQRTSPAFGMSAGTAGRRGPRPGGCPCACNRGGFCGGCGHAGCGRR